MEQISLGLESVDPLNQDESHLVVLWFHLEVEQLEELVDVDIRRLLLDCLVHCLDQEVV